MAHEVIYKQAELRREESGSAYDPESRSASFVFSTSGIDRAGDRIEQVWRLGGFQKNPVALFAHNTRELPIGRAENVSVVGGELHGDIVFASEAANPLAQKVWLLYQEKILNAVSVGFIPHSTRWERENDEEIFVMSDNELVEVSVVPVPANEEALRRMKELTPKTEPEGEPFAEMAIAVAAEARAEKAEFDVSLLRTQLAAAELRVAQLVDARNEERARAERAELALVRRDVDALVGVKITPAESAGLLKLAGLDKELFAKQLEAIRARPSMGLLNRVIPAERTEERAQQDNGKGLAEAVKRSAFGG